MLLLLTSLALGHHEVGEGGVVVAVLLLARELVVNVPLCVDVCVRVRDVRGGG